MRDGSLQALLNARQVAHWRYLFAIQKGYDLQDLRDDDQLRRYRQIEFETKVARVRIRNVTLIRKYRERREIQKRLFAPQSQKRR